MAHPCRLIRRPRDASPAGGPGQNTTRVARSTRRRLGFRNRWPDPAATTRMVLPCLRRRTSCAGGTFATDDARSVTARDDVCLPCRPRPGVGSLSIFDTLAQIAFAVTLVLPGFLVVQLSQRRRPSTPPGGDLELVLRGLVYALIIQALAALGGWLPHLIRELSKKHLEDHLTALAAYGVIVCVATPTVLGLLLGTWLRNAEAAGSLRWWHYALGGRDARRAWDYTFSQHDGSWMRVVLRDPAGGGPPAILGKYGKQSWASQTPADPDLYLQEVWPTDQQGLVAVDEIDRGSNVGMWINGDQIARIELFSGG